MGLLQQQVSKSSGRKDSGCLTLSSCNEKPGCIDIPSTICSSRGCYIGPWISSGIGIREIESTGKLHRGRISPPKDLCIAHSYRLTLEVLYESYFDTIPVMLDFFGGPN